MESAHLTKAHDHVRNAQTATLSSSIATAGDEHDHAAACFHEAAHDTHNQEALRILALLEDHHRQLAGLIKEAPRKPVARASTAAKPSDSAASTPSTRAPAAKTPAASTSPRTHRRLPQSSIASNLAEKRGIPSARRTTTGSPVTVAGAIAPRDDHATPVRDLLERHSRKPDQAASRLLSKPSEPPPEDNFRRFYSAFGGVISAISAPLAFTSLPLNPSPPTPAQEPPEATRPSKAKSRNSSPEASRTVKSSVPDLAALISKPALRALAGDGGTPLNPNESFYLVPTSGGTVTYASMLQGSAAAAAAAQPHHLNPIDEGSGSLKGSHDEFVDAQESVGPPSPTSARRPRSQSSAAQVVPSHRSIPAGRGTGLKTLEELTLENATLKSLVDKQAKRIQMWETNSQNQFNALAQSFRVRPPSTLTRLPSDPAALPSPPIPSPSTPATTTTTTTATSTETPPLDPSAAASRIAHLEAQLAAQTHRLEDLSAANAALARQHEKEKQVVARYREQWEKLKAGARKKEHERRERRLEALRSGDPARDSESADAADDAEGDAGAA